MRVIAGKAKGKGLKTPKKSWSIRPLTDQARGALFNILATRTPDARFLDVFAGTGAVGIEALSRGAALAIFVDASRHAVSLIRENLALTGLSDRAEVYAIDALRAVTILAGKGAEFDLIYLGAPYNDPALEKVLQKLTETSLLAPNGILIAEHRRQHALAASYGPFKLVRESRYGETVLAFYKGEQ
ncbi:MAG: 16S rRNA (guanine(966)-N(2))-methyltransferase RsmD [Candidatus Margulisbacteria bacterium]|nr:16S rRNA (guanine(966)-N(2))-methyltransferase RsmD [Candidatus Margulisiibacteriota bacterium]